LCFEDEAGQNLRPPKGRTWGRRGATPVVQVAGTGHGRISLTGVLATRPGCDPRFLYRTLVYHERKGEKKGFAEADYAALFDGVHQSLGGPLVVVWDNVNTHVSAKMKKLIAARSWLTVFQLPTYAPEFNPVEGIWAHMKKSLANLAKRTLDQLAGLVKTRLRSMQYRPELLTGLIAKTGLDFQPP